MSRAFVAVVPPAEVLDAVTEAFGTPDLPGARLERESQRHLTLQFLGNRVDLGAVASVLRSLEVGAGTAQLGGFGAFPNDRRARVLWLGVADGGPLLAELVAAVGAVLGPAGYPPEDRDYNPHLTLARWKSPTDLRHAVAALPTGPVGPPWTVEHVVLFESRTHPAGAEHIERARFALG